MHIFCIFLQWLHIFTYFFQILPIFKNKITVFFQFQLKLMKKKVKNHVKIKNGSTEGDKKNINKQWQIKYIHWNQIHIAKNRRAWDILLEQTK